MTIDQMRKMREEILQLVVKTVNKLIAEAIANNELIEIDNISIPENGLES